MRTLAFMRVLFYLTRSIYSKDGISC